MAKNSKTPGQPAMTQPVPGPRIAVCRFPGVIHVVGRQPMTAGAEVNLDDVVGQRDGAPVTLAEALGPHLQHFDDRVGQASPQPPVADEPPAEE
jgi:hypothetical protein